MTPILQLATEYCAQYVNDINLQEKAQEDMPLYARIMWGLIKASIPLFVIPRNIQQYLVGTSENPNLIEPTFDSVTKTVVQLLNTDTVVPLGEQYANYELFCCRQRVTDNFGNVYYVLAPNVTYDETTGNITIAASEENPIPAGTVYEIDFYTDGYFKNTLSNEQMLILGYCFQVIWQTRFNNDLISNISKIEDKSFTEQNRANKMNADTNRLDSIRRQLAEQMRSYEQNLAYQKTFPFGNSLI